ncbi:uncharacterized protein LOC120158142 isoform X2 [Hibiscus syriacus]|uniref:uncharacterized protein LOC120158142 isoform X2 n=1 Tax=Hibiscus syriacus TaxID=106335 RepID=UPI001923D813|nr:uncharacterized protein LOC120158142 isoform X2 [Hibiscus syriacus]
MLSIRFSHCIKVLLRLQSSDIALKNHNLNMSTLEVRGSSLRGYRRRKAVLDLNVPPSEIRELEGTSQQAGYEEQTIQSMQLGPPATIDVDAIDDDAIESSATSFAETRNNSRRNRGRTVVDVDSGVAHMCPTHNNPNRLRRLPTSPNFIDWESSTQSVVRTLPLSVLFKMCNVVYFQGNIYRLVIRSIDIVTRHPSLFSSTHACCISVFLLDLRTL